MKSWWRLLATWAWLQCGICGVAAAAPGIEERHTGPAPAGVDPVVVFEQFQRLQSQIEALTGRVEELEHALSQSREQVRANYEALDNRLTTAETAARKAAEAQAAAASPTPASAPAAETSATGANAGANTGTVAAPGASSPAAAGEEEQVLFDRGLALVREKKYDDAIKAFDQQLKLYPRGELAPVAMYWLGEMWLVAAVPDPAKAGRYFYRVYNEYPKSSRASLAMYRNALMQCESGDVPKGRVILNKVLIQYPASADAKAAEAALKNQCR